MEKDPTSFPSRNGDQRCLSEVWVENLVSLCIPHEGTNANALEII